MKKVFCIVLSYCIFAFLLFFAFTHFFTKIPELLPGETGSYEFHETLLLFYRFLPALIGTGFIVGFASVFGKSAFSVNRKFSSEIMGKYKYVFLQSLLYVFVLSFVAEIGIPHCERVQAQTVAAPRLYGQFMNLGKESLSDGKIALAKECALNALAVYPASQDATALYETALAAVSFSKEPVASEVESVEKFIPRKEIGDETVSSLIEKSKAAALDENWFLSHYYAQLAVDAGSSYDVNINEARRLASEAWNILGEPQSPEESEENILFRRKKLAYLNLTNGDALSAYYQFVAIEQGSPLGAKDADVAQFLKIATERVAEQCFFIDEFENIKRFETSKNVYFAIPHADGSKDVVFIRGITNVKNAGKMVQYLRGLSVISYSSRGTFLKSVSVPYAKMLTEPVSMFDEPEKAKFQILDSYESVPYILLLGIDRYNQENFSKPEYIFAQDYPEILRDEPRYMILGISHHDFSLIQDASIGSKRMNLISLARIYPRIRFFGFSAEIYGSDLLHRATYPLFLLILFIFLACIAWNYRLNSSQLFKFKWIFVMPFLTVALYFSMECLLYMIKLLDYIFIAIAGYYAIILAIIFEILVLGIVSFIFVTRTAD